MLVCNTPPKKSDISWIFWGGGEGGVYVTIKNQKNQNVFYVHYAKALI